MTGSIRKSMHGVALIALTIVVSAWVPSFLSGADIAKAQVSVGVGQTELSVGAAFDGSHIWYTLGYTESTSIYRIDPATDTVVATLDMAALTGRNIVPGGLAWDATRGHLWVATLFDVDALDLGLPGAGEIFEVDPVGGSVVSAFPTFAITSADGEPLSGVVDGLAFDPRTDTLWFSPLESLHVYQVTTDGTPVSSFALPFPESVWNAGITFDGNHLWLSLRTGGFTREAFPGFTEITLAEFTTDGILLRGLVSGTEAIGSEDIAFDAVTLAPACVVWVASAVSPLQSVEVPCPLQVEATLHPGDALHLEKAITLDALSAGGIVQPLPPVWWESECDTPGVTVTLQPERYEAVEIGAPLAFEEWIEVSPETAPGAYHCTVTFLTNPSAAVSAPFDEQEIWILVEASHLPAYEDFKWFKAKVELEDDEIEVKGKGRLGKESDGIDPLSEDVTLTVGTFSITIPAGSFTLDDWEEWEFEGMIDGMEVEMEIETHGRNKFKFEFEVEDGDFGEMDDRVEVTLTIGDDTGTTDAKVKLDDEDDEDDDDDGERHRRRRRHGGG